METATTLAEMAEMLTRHGERFAGNNVTDVAQDWIDHGFWVEESAEWCDIGCWDAATAAEWRDANRTPDQIQDAAEILVERYGSDRYTDGDPIYSACNGDTRASALIDVIEVTP